MSDRQDHLMRAAPHAAPSWTPEREERVRARTVAKRRVQERRHRALFVAALVMVSGALAVVGFRALWPHGPSSVAANAVTAAPVAAATLVRFEDGSVATALADGARVSPVEVQANTVGVRLEAGGARFSVAPNPERVFRVMARDVTVTVLGTVFTVAIEPAGVRVAVERGKVRVAWPAGERDLVVGESTVVSDLEGPAQARATSLEEQKPSAAPADVSHPARSPAGAPGRSWRSLAEEGDYARAFAKLAADGPSAVRDDPEDLLLAADVARLGGHPEKALASLERIVSAHPGDSRAPLAAFTLGRTLLEQLGRPREAAQAFANAERLSPNGALAQDALAREVESWSRAGDATLARERAERYSVRYPKGRRLQAVRRLGGLD